MVKKVDPNVSIELDDDTDLETTTGDGATAATELKAKVKKKITKAVAQGASRTEAVNIIGDIEPVDPDDEDDVKAWMKKLDQKLDKLIDSKSPPPEEPIQDEPVETPPPVTKWYDQRLI